ncbi:MAG: hypothetical protein KDK78_00050 [Chlamydiia bacterium]|nr:hypothetical protein [Chlamydiia bacterium]
MLAPFNYAPTTATSVQSFYDNNFLGSAKQSPDAIGAQFEAILFRMLLSQVRESTFEDELFGSSEMDHVQEMRDNELAQQLGTLNALGFKDLLSQEAERDSVANGLLKNPNARTVG